MILQNFYVIESQKNLNCVKMQSKCKQLPTVRSVDTLTHAFRALTASEIRLAFDDISLVHHSGYFPLSTVYSVTCSGNEL